MMFYLVNALGFFIQLAPCALMIFLPFPELAFRFERKRVLVGTALAPALLSALFPLVLMIFPPNPGGMAGNLMMLFAMLLILAAYVWLVREALIKKIMVFFIVLFYAVAQFCLANTIKSIISAATGSMLVVEPGWSYSLLDTLLFAATAAVMLPVTLLRVIRPLRDFIDEIEPRNMRREFVISTVSTTAFIAVVMYIRTIVYPQFFLTINLLQMFLILEQLLIYRLVYRESVRRKRDSDRQRMLEIQRLQYDNISREMENTRRLRHDMRHHLNALGALSAQGKLEEIIAYLKQYGAVYDRLSEMNFSGDPVADSVLEYYLAQAREQNIPVEYDVSLDGGSDVDATDMTVLLGNSLENALEALRQVPEGQRRLCVDMERAKNMILLRIQNTCAEPGDSGEPADWTAFTGREGRPRRGVGLSSVATIAEKYNGTALFQRKDGVFTTRVILNPTQAREDNRRTPQ